jgi:hypothetical protein
MQCDQHPGSNLVLRLTMQQSSMSLFSENDMVLFSVENTDTGPIKDKQAHCLGVVEGKEAESVLRVRCKLDRQAHAGNEKEVKR